MKLGLAQTTLRTAEIACEEFRVESPLCRESPSPHYESFPSLLATVDEHIRRLSREYETSDHKPDDVAGISRGVGEQFGSIVTASGYVAAVMQATNCGLPAFDVQVKGRVLGPYGLEVLERLRKLPPADEPADVDRLEAAVQDVADLLVLWISDIGFRWEIFPVGACTFGF